MKKYLLLLVIPALIASCGKNTPAPPVTVESYFPAKAGNYWVFEEFNGDTTGNFVSNGNISDSIYYVSDTSINGNKYHVYSDFIDVNYWLIWRDSSGYMVDQNGAVQFALQNFTGTLRTDSTYNSTVKYQMVNNVKVSTPAGLFNTLEFKGLVTASATFTPNPKIYYSNNYALNVGLVMYHTFNLLGPNAVLERRLVRYHVG